MKLLFIQDSGLSESLGIMDISALLKENGHSCDLLIVSEEKHIFEKIRKYSPDLIGFSCTTNMRKWAVSLAKEIKKRFSIPIILGGPHATYYPEIIENDCIDIICIGEGEYAILELLNNMKKKKDITKIQNLWIKKDKQIFKNSLRPLVQNLDELPLPDRGLYYDKYPFIKNLTMKRFISGRGCPYRCTFCHNPLLKRLYLGKGKFIRKKSVERIIKEIEEVKKKYPLKTIHFSDDTFCIDKGWLIRFLEIYKVKINLPFTCNVRIDLIDEGLVKKMKGANCYAITFGLETGNQKLRNVVIKKQVPNKTIIKNCRILKKAGIKILTTSMLALPGETLKNAFETIELNRKAGVDFSRINIFEAFPKLEIIEYAKQIGCLSKDFSVDTYEQIPQTSVLNSKYNKEFTNLCLFSHLGIKMPFLMPLIKQLIKIPSNQLFTVMNKLQGAYQEMRFFQISLIPGTVYFFHTFKSLKIF